MFVRTTLSALALATIISSPTAAREAVVGLSPNQEPAVLQEQVETVIQHLLQTVEAGEEVPFIDAANLRLIGTYAVPEGSAYDSPRAKLNANAPLLGAIRSFLSSARPNEANPGLIDLPGFLRFVGENYPAPDSADLIVIGSAIYQNPRAPRLDMADGAVPEDGYVSASVSTSPFGTRGLTGSLEGYDVYFGLTGENWIVSQSHAHYVERLWSISVDEHGGSLQFFDDDLATLFRQAGRDAPDRNHPTPMVSTDKLDVIVFHAGGTGELPAYFSAPPEAEAAPEPIWRSARNVAIALTWDDLTVDLDLYVRPSPSSSVIFYDQPTTPEGQMFKDFENSPTTGFESVRLSGTYDLSQMALAVNLYGGTVPSGVTGELRLAIGERVWAQRFTISATSGNRGAGAEQAIGEGEIPNRAWIILDPLEILNGD